MKFLKRRNLLFLFFTQLAFADTYVWEDYDDFSGSSLDSSKWDFSCWDGGNIPVVSNGRALLAGKTNYSWNDTIATDRMRAVNQSAGSMLAGGEPHSVLEFRESDELYGIELELTLPSDIPTDSGIGIYAIDYNKMFGGYEEQSIRFDLDLWYSGGTPEVQVTWKNPNTGTDGEANHIAVSKGVAVKLAFIRDDENIEFFCNDTSVASSPYQNAGETFIVRTVNENGNAFTSYIDNVRVLRRANTTPLDGTVLMLSAADGVSETLSFENGVFTSTFVDPEEGTFVDTDKSYTLDQVSDDIFKIILDEGDTYEFNEATGTGSLVDYENGVIDTEGTWSFTFERLDDETNDDSQTSSGLLDGSVFQLASTDGVSETLSFENGVFTSTFVDPEEGTFVDTDKSYTLDQVSDDIFKIILDEGDTYEFNEATGTGSLVDYENGVIDTEGTWSFTFERHDWEDYDDFSSGSLDSGKWDVWWGAGGELPTVVNGALKLSGTGNEAYPASSVIPDDLTYSANLPSKHSVALINQDDIYGMQAEFMIPANPSDDTGLNFIFFDWASDGSNNGFGPELEYRSNSGLRTEFAWTDPVSREDEQITRSAQFGVYYKMSLIHTDSTNSMYLNGELIEEFSSAGFSPDSIGFAAFNDDGLPYETYVKNVRVLRRGQTSEEPDPVTVVSDPNGQAVVVQVGDEYKWNSTLDGVTLWSVDESGGDVQPITMRFENGRNFGNEGFYDSVVQPQPYDMPYVIDDNGYIKVTEDSGYQYYHVISVENGIIATLEGDEQGVVDDGVSVADQWFFTTRAAAEEFYYSKVNPKDWMWFDHYPWVYSQEEQGWLYFYPSGGKLLYWSNKNQAWREFNQ